MFFILVIHVVEANESLYSISKKYNKTIDSICLDNGINKNDKLVIGQSLIILEDNLLYTVVKGNSIYSISKKFNISMDKIKKDNNLSSDNLYPGQTIKIIYSTANKYPLSVNGYAYTNIKKDLLEKALPNLTYLSIFSYNINYNGTLSKPNDDELIKLSYKYNVAPLMVVTNIGENEGFDSNLVSAILNDNKLRNSVIDSLFSIAVEKGYYGVDVDFEYVYKKDKDLYVSFLNDLKIKFKSKGLIVTTAIAPKISDNQKGILYEGHDYKEIGYVIDYVTLMTYEWGNTVSSPMSVAPINEVSKVINYGTRVINNNKILMGVPNYGYSFYIPKTKNAVTFSNNFALEKARETNAIIEFDEKAQTPYFYYYEGTQRRVCYFEDARSYNAKLDLVFKEELQGISIWTIMRYFQPLYTLLENRCVIKKVI